MVRGLRRKVGATELLNLHVGHAGEGTMDQTFDNLTDDELFALARRANQAVFVRAEPIVRRIANKYCKQYTWIDPSDLAQSMLQEVPRIAFNFNENDKSGNTWAKYLYWRMQFVAKDCLRKEDPLGICWPQKKAYPQWHRLGDESLTGFVVPDAHEDEVKEVVVNAFDDDLEALRSYFAEDPIPKKLTPNHWDKVRGRVRFRGNRSIRLASWVKEYWQRRGKPMQMELWS